MTTGARAALVGLTLALAGCGRQGGSGPGAAGSGSATAYLASLPAAYRDADLANGKLEFGLCRSCHTIVQGGPDQTGPNLYGLFGRKAGTRPEYAYSDALKGSGLVWDAASLDKWLADPRADVPGTKMTFVGLKDDKDRRDLIAYLKVASSGGPQ